MTRKHDKSHHGRHGGRPALEAQATTLLARSATRWVYGVDGQAPQADVERVEAARWAGRCQREVRSDFMRRTQANQDALKAHRNRLR